MNLAKDRLPEGEDEVVLSNGAILQCLVFGCDVCRGRGEELESGIYMLEYQGQQIYLCDAHAVQLLEADEDEQEKGGVFQEFLTFTEEPKVENRSEEKEEKEKTK